MMSKEVMYCMYKFSLFFFFIIVICKENCFMCILLNNVCVYFFKVYLSCIDVEGFNICSKMKL